MTMTTIRIDNRVCRGRFQHFDKVLDFYYIAPTMTMTVTTISVGFVES